MNFYSFVKAGDQTACAPLNFIRQIWERLPIFHHFPTAESAQQHFIKVFESCDRWEYVVINDAGETRAVMAMCIDDYDFHKGEPVLCNLLAGSLDDGLLFPAYRFMLKLAREQGVNWILTSRTDGETVTYQYKSVK